MAYVNMSQRCNRCLESGATLLRMWGRVHWCVDCAKADNGPDARKALLRHEFGEAPEGYTPAVLKEIALRGGIMDANELFAPAGKLSEAETRAREAAAVIVSPILEHEAGKA